MILLSIARRLRQVSVLVLVMGGLLLWTAAPLWAGDSITVVVRLAPGVDPQQVSSSYQATLLGGIPLLAIYRLQGQSAALPTQLAADPRVLAVELDQRVATFQADQRTFTDADFTALQHYFSFGNGDKLDDLVAIAPNEKALVVRNARAFEQNWLTWWQQASNLDRARLYAQGSAVKVAILDTGADLDHPALVGHLLSGYDFVDNDAWPEDVAIGLDEDDDGRLDEGAGHGTAVAGILAAVAPGAQIIPIRVLDSEGGGLLYDVVNGLAYAVAQGAQVINLSISTQQNSVLLQAAIEYALQRQIIVVAAAAGTATALDYPAAYPGVVAVGATRLGNYVADFSLTYAPLVDLFAPGELLYSPYLNGGYAWWSGSSMATPVAAGAAALLIERGACTPACTTSALVAKVQPVIPAYAPLGNVDGYQALIYSQGFEPQPTVCLLVLDQSALNASLPMVQQLATSHGVSAEWLINGDRAGTKGNGWLRWNKSYPGDRVLLPGGLLTNEGWFALPATTPWSLQDFFEGNLPQEQLKTVADVMPLHSQDLVRLVGRTCAAVVYAGDILLTTSNSGAVSADLRGNRLGRFAFTVVGVEVPAANSMGESGAKRYPLWLQVAGPQNFTARFATPLRRLTPDALQLTKATYQQGNLTVWATGNGATDTTMRLSIDGADGGVDWAVDPFLVEAPMRYNANAARYEFTFATPTDLTNRHLTITTNGGGVVNHALNQALVSSNTTADPPIVAAIPNGQQLFLPLIRLAAAASAEPRQEP